MKIRNTEINARHTLNAIFCIGIGTGVGLIVYGIFLFFHIDIFGWNLGLIFAPLVAGYVETILANRVIGENLGAISAFIMFISTTFYSFILKNPTLGVNLITAGSIIVILQAAFPTLINYILLVVVGGFLSILLNGLQKFVKRIELAYQNRSILFWDGPPSKPKNENNTLFDENKSNERLNNMDFYFITSTDILDKKYNLLGIYQSDIIIARDNKLIKLEPEKVEIETLNQIKQGKDDCLVKLVEQIKRNGGNGILDLSMNYNLNGLGGDTIQITAFGIGLNIQN